MSSPPYRWHKIADDEGELPFETNGMMILEVGDKKISLAKFDGEIFAFAFKCPHASGILADGWLDPLGNIVCPVHRYKYNIKNGRNTSGEGYYLPVYPVEKRKDGIYVGFKAGGLFNW